MPGPVCLPAGGLGGGPLRLREVDRDRRPLAGLAGDEDLPPALPLESSDGIQLGALAGLFGAIVGLFLTGVVYLMIGNVAGQAMMDMMMNAYDSMGILEQMPPEAIDQMEMSAQESPLNAVSIIGSLIINPLFGLLGGLIGYQIHKPKGGMPPATPAATPPPAV